MKSLSVCWLAAAQLSLAGPPVEPATAGTETSAKLTAQLSERRYVEFEQSLSEAHDLVAPDRSFFSGILASHKNQTAQSLRMLEPLLVQAPFASLSAEQRKLGWEALVDDYTKSFQYAKAAAADAQLLKQFTPLLTPCEKRELASDRRECELKMDYPPQTVKTAGPFTVQTKRDALGLIEGPVQIGGTTLWAVLDTGAGGTAITMTGARRLGLKISKGTSTEFGATGRAVHAHAALLPKLQIGTAEFQNVAVMVFDDRDLHIAPLHFELEMIIGYPAQAALGRVTFYADGRMGACQPTDDQGAAMFMDGNTPLIAAKTPKGARLFSLDTGAWNTVLYDVYWRENEEAFSGRKPGSYRAWGVGGSRTLPAFSASEVPLTFGTNSVVLHKIAVLTKPHLPGAEELYYGNLGEDLLRSLRSWTIDFQSMRFDIEPAAGAVPGTAQK